MTIEIVDLPMIAMVIFHSYVSLPEGIVYHIKKYRRVYGTTEYALKIVPSGYLT
jgi:hypothetical protein